MSIMIALCQFVRALFRNQFQLAAENLALRQQLAIFNRASRKPKLFTFVLVKGVEPTNNSSERILRNSALDRKAGRTNQTEAGAHRRSVIVSVLESLRTNLENFTLANVLEEVARWMREGKSLFADQWQKITEAAPAPELNTS